MRRVRKRDIRKNRQIAERERDLVSEPFETGRFTSSPPPRLEASPFGERSGEVLASMQMQARILDIIVAEAERLETSFGHDDEAGALRDLEVEVRSLAASPASESGDIEDLVTEVAISITHALQVTEGLPLVQRVDEMARAALFLPSRLGIERH